MNRRQFIAGATALSAAAPAFAGEKSPLPKSAYYKVVMVDPRLLSKTKDTHPVGYENMKADVMGAVSLSHEESVKLRRMLTTALTSSDNVPFCGHAPAYVIVQMDDGKPVGYVSVCGLCKTWCGADGELRVLDDDELTPFLSKVLPLPAAFAKVRQLPDLMEMDRKKSFLELPTPS